MQDLIQERERQWEELQGELKTLKACGITYSDNEANYRKALRIAELNERASGQPAALVPDLARGQEHVAGLKALRDASEAVYKASQEAINCYKLRIKTLNEDIAREWTSGGCQ